MEKLLGFQRRYLRGLANTLKPVVFIGKNGLTDDVFEAIDEELDNHELIKIRFNEFKDQKKALAAEISQRCNCHQVGVIGHVALFYRQHPEPEERDIQLPV